MLAAVALTTASAAHAETQGIVADAYYDFLAGFDVTINEATIQLLSVAIALLLALWSGGGLPRVWLFVLLGMVTGGVLGAFGWVAPYMPGYLAGLLTAALAAWSPEIGRTAMRAIIAIATLFMGNAALSGYPWQLIPLFGYVGVAAAMVCGIAMVYVPARLSLRLLPYSWVPIAWRAIAAWAVALAVLMIALGLAFPPDNMQNWFDNWIGSGRPSN